MTVEVEAIVIGAGVVGLACARELAIRGLDTYVLEKESTFGMGISSRNSEVIHAGLYYPTGSLKAKLCVDGRNLLYKYCAERNIPHKKIGKWVVAKSYQEEALIRIYKQAIDNGCSEVSFLDKKEAIDIEPNLSADLILNSPETGIVDSHGLMLALLADFQANSGQIIFNSEVKSWTTKNNAIFLQLNDRDLTKIRAKFVINAAGLGAVPLLQKLNGFPRHCIPEYWFAKGNYFKLTCASPFSRLIYPIPEKNGLGIHLTLDLNLSAKFGPDVEYVDQVDYLVNPQRNKVFANAIKNYWEDVDVNCLTPDYSGIRPKIGSRDNTSDFIIQNAAAHHVNGLVNLLGIESPGLTSCLSIANVVAENILRNR